ncbi:hypothetical protein PHYPSEUDO_011097 [Phytophthora pseudosyringae]|uniref:Uncharacterized protein n=1 Tax=Phytophthora pseudosyringae TaxID=221518 RepID=A0A8T1WBS6_9STRA|nr:hypothetical protein PHYPSEUDO_011097 [Phytophthora pseudosyringae]
MLPPIHKSTNGLSNERRGSGGGFFNESNRKQPIAAGFSSPSRVGYPENQSNDVLSVGTSSAFPLGQDRLAERMHGLERENEHFREELQHLRHFYSSNQQQHENDKLSVGKVAEDLQRLAHSFNNKLQADMSHQQREQQKAALLFAEVARLGHRVEGLESELRGIVEDTHRKFEAQEQHAQFMASVSSKQQHQAASPTRNAELHRQLRDIQDAMVQLRCEVDTDRSARWKNDAAIDAKLDAQLDRLNSKLTADKRDLACALDEQRQLVTGADFQRVTSHMREFSRVNDHLLALERWLHSEFGQIKRVFQSLAGDVDARFQCVLVELASGLKMWHAAQTRQEEDIGLRFHDLEEAVQLVVGAMQRKVRTLEEVIPLEVQARQKNDDKLRRRVEGVVKALGHAIETSRGEYLPQQSMLEQRVHQLELGRHKTSDEVSMQHSAMRETIQVFMEDSDAMLARLAAAVEQERIKGVHLVTAREAAPLEIPRDELAAETRRIGDALSALQAWTTLHEHECHQSRQVTPVAALTIAPVAVTTHGTEEMRMEAKRVKEELSALQTWAAMHGKECLQSAPAVVSPIAPGERNVEANSTKDEIGALQAWTVMHAQECRQFFDFLNWSMDDVRRESAVVQCLDTVIDQIVETQACGHLNTLAKGVTVALRQTRPASTVTPVPSLTSAAPKRAAKRDRPSRTHYTVQIPDKERYSQPGGNISPSPVSEEGASDMLDLSTTTYYASTDGEVDTNVVQIRENEESGERQQETRAQVVRDILAEEPVHPVADNDTYAIDMLGSPCSSYPGSMGNAQVNLASLVDNDPAVDPRQQINDAAEDEYSIDMTHDEEMEVVDRPAIAHSSPAHPRSEAEPQGNLHGGLQSSAEPPPPQENESPDEEESLTLDL